MRYTNVQISDCNVVFSRDRETLYLTPVEQRYRGWMLDRVTASWWQLSSPPDPRPPSREPGAHSNVQRDTRIYCKVHTHCLHDTYIEIEIEKYFIHPSVGEIQICQVAQKKDKKKIIIYNDCILDNNNNTTTTKTA